MNAERLIKLADHLESGKLGHAEFDFGIINSGPDGTDAIDPTVCGTLGCAMGELPILFPDVFMFISKYGASVVCRRNNSSGRWHQDVCEFFDIDGNEQNHLFYPHGQDCLYYGGIPLNGGATAEQVASNIRAFVAKKIKDAETAE